MDERIRKALVRKAVKEKVQPVDLFAPSEKFVRFLRFIGLVKAADAVTQCGVNQLIWGCVVNLAHKGLKPMFCREARVCPRDDWFMFRSQVNDMKFILYRLFSVASQRPFVWTIDFTIGKDLWDKVPRGNLSRLGKIAYESMQEYFNEKWGFPVKFGMDCVVQYWHSEAPSEGWMPHVHAIVPRFFLNEAGRPVKDVRMKLLGASAIKRIWRRRMQAEYGKSRAKLEGEYEKFDVRVKWVTRESGLDHRLRYMYRGVVRDYAKAIDRGVDYSGWNIESARRSLLYNHKRHQSYGLLAARNLSAKSDFMRAVNLDLGTKREREKIRRHASCPDCGGDIEPDHGDDSELLTLSRQEAVASGLPRWRSFYEDENLKWTKFEPYTGSTRHG